MYMLCASYPIAKVKFTLEQPMKGGTGIVLIFNLGTGWGWWSTPRPARFTPRGKNPVPIVQEAGTNMNVAKNLELTIIRSPDLPVRSEWLYRLSYPGHIL